MTVSKSRNKFAILIFLITLLAVIGVACGPTEEEAGGAGSTEDSEPNANTADNELAIAPDSVETDRKGLTVGFTKDGHAFRGDPEAPVVIQEFSDFQCPYCAHFYNQTLPALEDNQIANGDAVLVYYDFPLTTLHPQANAAANAGRCAAAQGAAAFWDYHDQLFGTVNSWSNSEPDTFFISLARELNLDADAFQACLEESAHQDAIRTDVNTGASFGISGTPSFLVNGQLLIGAQPLTVFESAIVAVANGEEIAGTSSDSATGSADQQPAVAPTPAVFTADYAAAMGDPNAPVTIVEFTDYQCPYCSQHATQVLPQVVEDMVQTGRVYYILKDFPLDQIHPDARIGALAARCAGAQDAYWEMHDALFSQQSVWSGSGEEAATTALIEIADSLDLDTRDFTACLQSGRFNDAIETNVQEGRALGISGTPHFFVDGYPLSGARPYEHFDLAVGLAEEGRLAEAFTQPAEDTTQQQAPEQSYPLDVVLGDAPQMGDPNAPIVMVEFTDFQCPYCAQHFRDAYPQLIQEYIEKGVILYVVKDFPLKSIHPQAAIAAEAAACAEDQGAFWEMHDILFDRQSEWGISDPIPVFSSYASELGLDTAEYTQCLQTHKHEADINAEQQQGIELGVT
ncbi:MAG: thioredoxin domain-containing protein, partial [Candidatus Promineifilaceae bacterium]